jgi:uncharacterized protein
VSSFVRVPVSDLVGHPGETRGLRRDVEADAFGAAPWGPAEHGVQDPVELDLHLDAVVEGILVRGTLGFHVELPCARCLVLQRLDYTVEVAELFQDPTKREDGDEDDPGYELIDDLTAIDLSTLARDALIVDLPVRVLCTQDCRGLCVECGADRNATDCGHRPEQAPDPRWAKLADLDLPTE